MDARTALRQRFGLYDPVPLIKLDLTGEEEPIEGFELFGDIDKKGTKPGGGGQPQGYDDQGRYVGRVGSRNPRGSEMGEAHMRLSDVLADDPKYNDKAMKVMTDLAGFSAVRNVDEAAELVSLHVSEALDRVDANTEAFAKQWYPLAHDFDRGEAASAGLHPDVVHAITARLSPQKDWNHNLAMTRAFVRSYAEDPTITQEVVDTANMLRISMGESGVKDALPPLKSKGLVGSKLNSLPPELGGELIRSLAVVSGNNFTINIDGTPNLSGAGKLSGIGWQSVDTMGRAMKILQDPSRANVDKMLGSQHKIRSFYENIRDPHNRDGFDDVTVDTHAFGIATGIPMPSSLKIINRLFSSPKSTASGTTGAYPIFVEGYRRARERAGNRFTNTAELQAVTWESWRKEWPRTARKKWVLEMTQEVRRRAAQGKITHAEANEIINDLRLQLPGVAPSGRGAGSPKSLRGLPPWLIESVGA